MVTTFAVTKSGKRIWEPTNLILVKGRLWWRGELVESLWRSDDWHEEDVTQEVLSRMSGDGEGHNG